MVALKQPNHIQAVFLLLADRLRKLHELDHRQSVKKNKKKNWEIREETNVFVKELRIIILKVIGLMRLFVF